MGPSQKYIYIYTVYCVCVCVCVYYYWQSNKANGHDTQSVYEHDVGRCVHQQQQ